ncbi:ABC transporter permease [Cyclobacterium jeungdonense]|uniref:Transport permease protein n=1 Tax=Cyclobacterium jeungdonense TaxID=708087 RepID=A0ABT8CA21_9BACT|nr:ABC transporter permease [Cyclobacterium jeungdonense]MDN3688859.1 ABC transporter permease [Cyclobacterium jeungdonense]
MDTKTWTLIIKPKTSSFDLHLNDLWRYRDLLFMFVKRDFVAVYKQTILGPLWFIIQPILTTILFMVVFDQVAGIPTDGAPPALFYLSGLVIWNYFSSCLLKTSNTFTNNAGIFGKVYFPRLIVPLSIVISALISFGIQLGLLLVLLGYFFLFLDSQIQLNYYLFFLPILLAMVAALGLGFGIIISSLTTKYRDLVFLVSFGVQLLMYVTPVIYPLSFFSGNYKALILANPLTPIIEFFRFSILGVGDFSGWQIGYSVIFTIISLLAGILLFNKVERDFMDVI